MPVCQETLNPPGCLLPCSDVFLCATVDRATDGNVNEYAYTITLQNCSGSILYGDFSISLGKLLECDATPVVLGNTGEYQASAVNNNGTINVLWDGISEKVILRDTYLRPGSFQFWVRFTRNAPNADIGSYLPSEVSFVGKVEDLLCKYPCKIMKCITVDGDCLSH